MIHNATNLIAETFEERDVKHQVREAGDMSFVEAGFMIDAGPAVVVRFISNDDDNDVAIRILGLIHKVPEEKHAAIMDACRQLTEEIRYYKFYLDHKSDVNVEYDLPVTLGDEFVGPCCFEMFVRIMKILDEKYQVLAAALYGDAPITPKRDPLEMLRLLRELRSTPIEASTDECA